MYKIDNLSNLMYQCTYWCIFLSAGCSLLLFPSMIAGEETQVCQTQACETAAKRILRYMDHDVKPCENFYKFACGKFLETATIKEDEVQNDSRTELDEVIEKQLLSMVSEKITRFDPLPYRNVKSLYSLCMDEDKINSRGAEPAIAMLNSAGGWPLLGTWDEENWNAIDTLISLHNLGIGDSNILQIYVALDVKRNRRILQVFRSAVGIYYEYLRQGEENEKVQKYFRYMVDMAEKFGADKQTATDELKEVLHFEIEMSKKFYDKKDQEITVLKRVFTFKELKEEIGWIDWTKLFNGILPETAQLAEDELIAVWDADFIKNLEHFISRYPKKVRANYMMWRAVNEMVNELSADIRKRHDDFFAEINEIDITPGPRWQTCLSSLPSLALSSLYINKYFDQISKMEAVRMTNQILEEITLDLKEVNWMDETTRDRALYKAAKISKNIGFPDKLGDIREIELYYEGLDMDKDNYFEAMFNLGQWSDKKKFLQIKEPYNKKDWTRNSNIEAARIYYSSYDNSINVPAGALQQPLFNTGVPNYLNFASAGFLEASEIMRAFDNRGCKRNVEGNLEDWCEKETLNNFEEKSKCMIEQYNGFIEPTTQLNVNGSRTVNQNIADNGGMKLAFRAYRRLADKLDALEDLLPGLEQYDQDQLFLLSLANTHCTKYDPERLKLLVKNGAQPPAEIIVNGMMKNMPHFSQIFKCNDGDPMDLKEKEKCVVW